MFAVLVLFVLFCGFISQRLGISSDNFPNVVGAVLFSIIGTVIIIGRLHNRKLYLDKRSEFKREYEQYKKITEKIGDFRFPERKYNIDYQNKCILELENKIKEYLPRKKYCGAEIFQCKAELKTIRMYLEVLENRETDSNNISQKLTKLFKF